MSAIESLDRYSGCLLGLAVADATGTTLEFRRPGTFLPLDDMVGGGPFNLKRGYWTDDTSMALCLADSLLACQGYDARDQMERYRRWYREGYFSPLGYCFDIGGTTRTAIQQFERTGNPLSGSSDPSTAGNGSIMRLAPIPMAYARHPAEAVRMSGESSRTTHGAQTAVDACRYLGGLIVGALQGETKEVLLSSRYSPAPGSWEAQPLHPEIDEVARGSYQHRQPPEIKGTGYVVRSLEAALWAFYHSDTYREGCLLAVNLGDDADTTAAVYGQLAGAYYGERGIPEEWRQVVYLHDQIRHLAEGLFQLSQTIFGG